MGERKGIEGMRKGNIEGGPMGATEQFGPAWVFVKMWNERRNSLSAIVEQTLHEWS